MLCRAPGDQFAYRRTPAQPDDNEVSRVGLRGAEDRLGRRLTVRRLNHFVLQASFRHLSLDGVQVLGIREAGVGLVAVASGVDLQQPG